MANYLDFEKSVATIEGKIREMQSLNEGIEDSQLRMGGEVQTLEKKVTKALRALYDKLTPWQKVQVARHPDRPHFLDYARGLLEDWTPLAGDRMFAEDSAILGGLGRFRGRAVVFMGHEKGHDTQSRMDHNFGMARPEGYRKAVRLMDLADRFGLPVVTLVDTAGAYPGVGAEERGQAEAIARSIDKCLCLGVPNICVVVGEGGSGGALAISTANKVFMLEHAIYTVASPEACASILWRDTEKAQEAAESLKLTAQNLLEFGVIDGIIPEPVGGAQRNPAETIQKTGDVIEGTLKDLEGLDAEAIRAARHEKFLAIGRSLKKPRRRTRKKST